jgi:serine/threonine protein kinase
LGDIVTLSLSKILDFGLAKTAIGEDICEDLTIWSNLLTSPGTTLGTVAYMSPELARGESVDARCALFFLGVVLYEATTGCRPFTGPTSACVFDAILNREPRSILELNPNVPLALQRIIARLLAKNPASRYSCAQSLVEELPALSETLRLI